MKDNIGAAEVDDDEAVDDEDVGDEGMENDDEH